VPTAALRDRSEHKFPSPKTGGQLPPGPGGRNGRGGLRPHTKTSTVSELNLEKGKKIAKLLHERFGHAGDHKWKKLVRDDKIKMKTAGVKRAVLETRHQCVECDLAKSEKKHTGQTSIARKGMWTTDTAGPWGTKSKGGKLYLQVTVAPSNNGKGKEGSGISFVAFQKRKDEAADVLDKRKAMMERTAGIKIREMRSDRGGEYTGKEYRRVCQKHGIAQSFTAPDSSTGPAENKIGTLQRMARAMQNQGGGGENLWPEAINYANDVTNILPSAAGVSGGGLGKSPLERAGMKRSHLHRLRPWGCLVVFHLADHKRRRGRNKGRRGRFMGLAPNYDDGWRILDESTGQVITSRMGRFHEEVFPAADTRGEGTEEDHVASEEDDRVWKAESKQKESSGNEKEARKEREIQIQMPALRQIQEEKQDPKDNHGPGPKKVRWAEDLVEEDWKMMEAEKENEDLREAQQSAYHKDPGGKRVSQRMRALPEVFSPTEAEDARRVMAEVAKKRTRNKGEEESNAHWEMFCLEKGITPEGEIACITHNAHVYNNNNSRLDSPTILSGQVPRGYKEAMGSADEQNVGLWGAAMGEELKSFKTNGVAKLVPRERGMRVVGSKWVFDLKDQQGKLAKQKEYDKTFIKIEGDWKRARARAVAKGFTQIYNVNYTHTYAPTPTSIEVRLMLAWCLSLGFTVGQMDVKSAFLIPKLPVNEEVFMEPLPGSGVGPDWVMKLQKSIYGLKQAANYFFKDAKETLENLDFQNLGRDGPCLFVHRNAEGAVDCLVLLHVDDFAIGAKRKQLQGFKDGLHSKYDMKDLGRLDMFLGLEVQWDGDGEGMRLSQRKAIEDLLVMLGMENCNGAKTPMEEKLRLSAIKQEEMSTVERAATEERTGTYGKVVGVLGWISEWTRPDITQATNYLRRFCSAPPQESWNAVKRVVRYLAGTKDFGLHYRTDGGATIEGYADSDFANGEKYESTTGNVFKLGNTALGWSSKKQGDTARSTQEAETIALDESARKGLWLRRVAQGLGAHGNGPLQLWEDNIGAEKTFTEEAVPNRTKYMAAKYFATKKDVEKKHLAVGRVVSAENPADMFTKPLGRIKFEKFRSELGVVRVW
jgi:transposase InsO family protein